MAAATTDKFKKVGASTVTSLAAPGKAIGATSITVGSTTNYPLDTGVVVAIRVVDTAGALVSGTYTEWNAIVTSATSLTLDPTPAYGSDQVYAAGSSTQVYISVAANAHNQMVDGLLVAHDQDGTLKAGAVDNAAVLADDVVETAKIKDGAVSTAKLVDGAVTSAKILDASVTIPKISNPYKFRVSRNAAANTGSGAFATIAFDTEQYDTNNNFASGVYTVPVTGYYHFDWNVNVTLTGAVEQVIASLFYDNVEYSTGQRTNFATTAGSGGSDTIYCVAGKVVDIRVYAPVARALIVGGTKETRFSGYLVSVA